MSHIPPTSKSWWLYVHNRPESNNNLPPLLPPLGSKAPGLILNITINWSVFLCSPWPSCLCAQHSSQNFHSKTPVRLNFFPVQNPPLASHVTLDKSWSPPHDWRDPTLHCFSDLISHHGSVFLCVIRLRLRAVPRQATRMLPPQGLCTAVSSTWMLCPFVSMAPALAFFRFLPTYHLLRKDASEYLV